jgi:hypothetical protein
MAKMEHAGIEPNWTQHNRWTCPKSQLAILWQYFSSSIRLLLYVRDMQKKDLFESTGLNQNGTREIFIFTFYTQFHIYLGFHTFIDWELRPSGDDRNVWPKNQPCKCLSQACHCGNLLHVTAAFPAIFVTSFFKSWDSCTYTDPMSLKI